MKSRLVFFRWAARLIAAVAISGSMLVGSARASVVVFENFIPGGSYSTSVGAAIYQNFYTSGTDTQTGYMFTPTLSGVLNDITLPLFAFASSPPSIAHARVMVFDHVDGHPGAELIGSDIVVGQPNLLGSPFATTSVVFSGALTLNQGQPYWLVVDALDPGTVVSWQYVNDYLNTSAIGANREVGEPWTIYYGNGGEGAFSVTAAPVPIPSALLLFISAVSPVVLVLRRTKRMI